MSEKVKGLNVKVGDEELTVLRSRVVRHVRSVEVQEDEEGLA